MKEEVKLEIEKNIPVPATNGKWDNVVADMKEGDSVFCKTKEECNRMLSALRYRKAKSTYRKMDGGFRVWKSS